MSLKSKRIEHLLKKASDPDYLSEPYTAPLLIRRGKKNAWCSLTISPELFAKRRSSLLGDDANDWLLPDIPAHISIMNKEEVLSLPKGFMLPPTMEFILTGDTKIIEPKEWKGVSKCIFEIVDCVEVRRLRMSLGFTPYLYENHEFHITLGIKLTSPSKSL